MEFRRQFNEKYKPSKGETNNGKSMTQPDMSLTVAQLMQGHTTNVNQGEYFDHPIPTIDDLTDLVNHRNDLNDTLKAMEAEIEENNIKVKAEKEEAAKALKIAKAAELKQAIKDAKKDE